MRIKDELGGRKVRCPECKEVLVVPQLNAVAEDEEVLDVLPAPSTNEAIKRPARAPIGPSYQEHYEERKPYRSPPPKRDPRPPELKRARKRRTPRVSFEEGWFGSTNAGAIGGILMMVIAVVWFFVGHAGGIIFIYPPILFVIGIAAFCKGLFNR